MKLISDGLAVLTPPFDSNIGLKQGCPMSPTLANIFLHDIHDMCNSMHREMEIAGHYTNSISWADDLVFFSLSDENTRKSLLNLQNYCVNMKLKLNITKTKYMIISKGSVPAKNTINFELNGQILEKVRLYKYLGVEIQENLKYINVTTTRQEKAQKRNPCHKKGMRHCRTSSLDLHFQKVIRGKNIPHITVWIIGLGFTYEQQNIHK